MFDISVTTQFSAAHQIPGYPGACARLHGHNWKVEVTIRATTLDHLGMALDYHQAEMMLSPIISELDHTHLNDHPFFSDKTTTSENVAYFIYSRMKQALLDDPQAKERKLHLATVTVYETDIYRTTYRETDD